MNEVMERLPVLYKPGGEASARCCCYDFFLKYKIYYKLAHERITQHTIIQLFSDWNYEKPTWLPFGPGGPYKKREIIIRNYSYCFFFLQHNEYWITVQQ